MRDELNEPLGTEPPPPTPFARLGPWLARAAAVATLMIVGAAGAWIVHRGLPPPAAVAIASPQATPAAAPSPSPTLAAAPSLSMNPSVTAVSDDVEATSGVKVVRNGGGSATSKIIDVPAVLGLRLPPAPDPRLVDKTRFGVLPRVGVDGSKPYEVYARPVLQSLKLKNAPRIGIVVGGLGLDAASTEAAIARLPPAVSLGFAPYGQNLADVVLRAREAGHEALLQAPMEAFDGAPPGPHMLTTAASEAENRESLQWIMGRFTGYIGVENYLGGKFTADRAALAPVLAEFASRGLAYLDDGSSPRSLAMSLAGDLHLRAGAADVVIDATPTPEAIEAALTRLEGIARREGAAIGVATALPQNLDHITRFAEALEARGVALTPVSALIGNSPTKTVGATP